MVNSEIADIFDRMSRLLAFKGADRFRVLAYERAARSIRDLKEDLNSIAERGEVGEIPGIGKDLSAMIEEYLKTRRIRRYDQERRGIPAGLMDLMEVPGLGPKTLAMLHRKYRVKSLEDLKRLMDTGALLEAPGFGEKKIENLRKGIKLRLSGRERLPLGVALPLAEALLAQIRKVVLVRQANAAGSVRRRKETIGDVDILISSEKPAEALREIGKLKMVERLLSMGDTKASFLVERGVQVDVRAVDEESYGAALQYFTGSKEHNVHLRTLARERGLKINEYGLFEGSKRVAGTTEEQIYRKLGMQLMPPEIREDRGEIEAALENRLPPLIEVDDLRGEFHAHTNYSDGTATVEEMAAAAGKLGYEYIGLSDHSPAARVAHGLELDRVLKKTEEVRRAEAKIKGAVGPRILIGTEVDILTSGELDYDERTLRLFDVVIASVHSSFKQSKDRMTGRILDAMANPYVHIIGHPSTRLLGTREPVEFDLERVINAAVEHGVALEINGSILRLDISDVMARAAAEAGALLAIGSDAHRVSQLDEIRYGVFQARRGWVEAKSVVNTWAWPKLSQWLQHRHSSYRSKKASA